MLIRIMDPAKCKKTCDFEEYSKELGLHPCGKPVLARIHGKFLCKEHALYALSSMNPSEIKDLDGKLIGSWKGFINKINEVEKLFLENKESDRNMGNAKT